MMKAQNLENHARLVPPFHFFLVPLSLLTFITSIVHLIYSVGREGLVSSIIISVLSFAIVLTVFFPAKLRM